MGAPLFESSMKSLPFLGRGKVRDMYAVGGDRLLIVTTDRLSAFDVILPDPIPDKGRVLNELSNFWFKKLKPLPIEAVVRGYLIGSGLKDYQKTSAVCGIRLPAGLKQADKLPEVIFTPATKAETGHDENISFEQAEKRVGKKLAAKVRDVSIRLYREAADYALQRGIIIADTKFEFGTDEEGNLVLIDEALTSDSSRFWPADRYRPGTSPPSFDKQYVRDYLETLDWNKAPPAPRLPAEVIARTSEKYREALYRLTGRKLGG